MLVPEVLLECLFSLPPITSPQLLIGIGCYDAGKGINSEKIEKILQWKK